MKLIKPLSIAVILMFAGLAIANPHHQKGAKNPLMRALHQLDLSEQQRLQVKQIIKSSKSERKTIAKQMVEGKTQMARLLDTDKQDKTAVEALATHQSQLIKQMILFKAELFSQVRAVLNEEQRVKLSKMRQKREKIRGIMLEDF